MTSAKDLFEGLDRLGVEVTEREAKEALWLLAHMARSQAPSVSPRHDHTAPGSPPGPGPYPASPAEPSTQRPAPSLGRSRSRPPALFHQAAPSAPAPERARAAARPGPDALPIGLPEPSELRNQLDLQRALRPLRQTIRVGPAAVLDEESSAQESADAHTVMPVWTQASQRWLSLALVVDAGPTMILWRRLAAELQVLLSQVGAFQSIRTWQLSFGSMAHISPSASPADKRSPGELIDPAGRQLILVLSDCVDQAWRSGVAMATVAAWARSGPLAIVQPLAQRMWSGTGLPCHRVQLRAPFPGAPNHQLIDMADPTGKLAKGILVPVLELGPGWLAPWARLVAGTGKANVVATYATAAESSAQQRAGNHVPSSQVASNQRASARGPAGADALVDRFRAGASPDARKLAGYLAAAPLTLPVMRTIQRVMLPDTRSLQLAEVYLSGLLRPVGRIEPGQQTEARYDFLPGVRDILLGTIKRSEAIRVAELASAEFNTSRGTKAGFPTQLRVQPGTTGTSMPAETEAFGHTEEYVLRRIGGVYARAAETAARSRVYSRIRRAGQPGQAGQGQTSTGQAAPGQTSTQPGKTGPPGRRPGDPAGASQRSQPRQASRTGPSRTDPAHARAAPAYHGLARLLRAEQEVVPFLPRPELLILLDWCTTGPLAGLRLVGGGGGTGKTRLAIELGRRLRPAGWQVVWPEAGSDRAAINKLVAGAPALVVVDYAEGQGQLPDLLSAIAKSAADRASQPVRVLLLARNTIETWLRLQAQLSGETRDLLSAAEPLTLGPMPASEPADAYQAAITAFASALGVSRPAGTVRQRSAGDSRTVLDYHLAALLTIADLASGRAADAAQASADATLQLLDHEARYWQRVAVNLGLRADHRVLRRAVAVGCLAGADDLAAATEILACADPFLARPEHGTLAARWLHELYPAEPWQEREWLGVMSPDVVAERLIVEVFANSRSLLPQLLSKLPQERIVRSLTTLARARDPDLAVPRILRSAFADDPDFIAIPAVRAAASGGSVLCDLLSRSIADGEFSPGTLRRVAMAIPYPTTDPLTRVAIEVLPRVLRQPSTNEEARVGHLADLALRQAQIGHDDQALVAAREVGALYRGLTPDRREEIGPTILDALGKVIRQLRAAGQPGVASDVAVELSQFANSELQLAELGFDETDSQQHYRRTWPNIALIGAPKSGKTTFLGALHLAMLDQPDPVRQEQWRVISADHPSATALVKLTTDLAHRRFPPASTSISHYRCMIVGERLRPNRRPRAAPLQGEETDRFYMYLTDSPGSAFGPLASPSLREEIANDLSYSRGLVIFFDPVGEADKGDAVDHLLRILADLGARAGQSKSLIRGKLPHYVAVCVAKFDDSRVFRTAILKHLIAFNRGHYGFPRVHDDYSRELLDQLCGVSKNPSAHLFATTIDRYFLRERVKYFTISSIGFYADPDTDYFVPDDYQNAWPIDATFPDTIRGVIRPINVAEPILWLGRRLAAEPD